MKRTTAMLLVAGIIGALSGLASEVWAGPAIGAPPPCQVANPGAGALPIKGTLAVEVLNPSGDLIAFGNKNTDYTWRLERSGVQKFFRLHLVAAVGGLSSGDLVCLALADPGLTSQILNAFGLPPNLKLVITDSSISQVDTNGLQIPGVSDFLVPIPLTFTCQTNSQVQVQVAGTQFLLTCKRGDVIQVQNVTTQFFVEGFSNIAEVTIYAVSP